MAIITNNNSLGLTFSYYTSLVNANTANNQIASIFNNQTANTVYSRIENADSKVEIIIACNPNLE